MSEGFPGYAFNPLTRQMQFVGQVRKPRYYCTDGANIVVPASTTSPIFLVIGGAIFTVTSDLTCRSSDAAGDFIAGFAANTPYYLYVVIDDVELRVVADIQPPTKGPRGYEKWTYVGACATDSGGATFGAFQSSGGICLANGEIELESVAGGGARTSKTFSSCPVTARSMYARLQTNAGAAGDDIWVSGTDTTEQSITVEVDVNAQDDHDMGWIPLLTPRTVWITPGAATDGRVYLMGWQENPSEYQ